MFASPSDAPRVYTLSDFDFTLPPALIAQHPAPERSASRLLDGTGPQPVERIFRELPALLQPGDLLVFNDTQVVKARLFGNKPPPRAAKAAPPHGGAGNLGRPGVALPTGGKLELLVERVLPGFEVVAHLKTSKKPPVGTVLRMHGGYTATLLGRWPDEDGALFRLRFSAEPHALMLQHGHVPLPPYIERHQGGAIEHGDTVEDESRYQTVFAAKPGAAAAPTAALHFDEALLAALEARGVQRASVTLHVGAGTFSPVKTENLAEHRMHREWYEVPLATQRAIAETKARGGRIVAVGTTTVRTLESWAKENGVGSELRTLQSVVDSALTPFSADTQIFITPGFQFQLVDLLITNFHLPKSTLMMLVSAFAGYAHVMALYRHAIAQRYRFFSYGDAMLLQRRT